MHLNKIQLTFISLLISLISFCQTKTLIKKDSIKTEHLNEVVVTAQYAPQTINKAVHEVTIINRQAIASQAGNTLADVLNQTLNINIIPSASTGKSSVQLFGLDSQYFKIMIDDVPLINDEGFGNNTDLTQINLDDIEQIEIVEGAMGVEYGANAVSGVINIITKKSSKYKWSITPYIQEETIGNEYNFNNEGRHIQSLNIGHNFSNKLYANAIYTRNNFNGFFDNQKGQHHFLNDSLRGHSWLPKLQNTVKFLANYKAHNNFTSFYKFEYFKENIEDYSELVFPNFNPSTNTTNPLSTDRIFSTERMYHLLHVMGKINGQINYNLSFSYQQQKRNLERYQYFIRLQQKFDIDNFEFESRKVIYTKGNFSNFITNDTFNFQVGYEINKIDGFSSREAGTFDGENIKRTLGSYDVFGSGEYHINNNFSLRGGIRTLFSSTFKTQAALSLNLKYILKNNYELRLIGGTSPKLPTYEELYTFFVDANHDVRGNPDLNPEQGQSLFLHLKKKINFAKSNFQSKLSLNYLNVKDRIELAQISAVPLQSQYINIDAFKTIGVYINNTFKSDFISGNFGISYAGQSKTLDSQTVKNDSFLWSWGLNLNTSFKIKPLKTTFSLLYKYNGKSPQFVQSTNTDGDAILIAGIQDAYSMLDASFRKKIIKDKIEITIGARNLLNITQVNTSAIEGTAHTGNPQNILLGYGRSYFLKLIYNLNF